MAKPSPVMKHSQRTAKTAEQVAIEEFMNSIPPAVVMEGDTIIDNTIPETMVVEDTSLDPIVDSAVVADSLDDLAGDVDGVTTAAAMESYKRIFSHMTELTGHPVASLENFPATKGGVRKFAKAIRAHASDIRSCVMVALEDYVDKVDESIGTTMSNYKQALKALDSIKEGDINVDGKVTVNYKQVWKLFHMGGELMDLNDFSKEVENVKKLADKVSAGKQAVQKWQTGQDMGAKALDGSDTFELMGNVTVKIKDGRSHWEAKEVPAPKREWTAGDWFWIMMFNWAGLAYRLIKGGSGEEQTKKEQSLKAMAKVVGELKKLAPVVQGIENDAKAIMAIVEHAPEEEIGNVKRAVSPVLELASKTIQHVAEVTYGAKSMFESASA